MTDENGLFWLNLGCGGTLLPSPWQNHDIEMDIRNPLPFPDASVKYIVIGHCIEHCTPAEGYRFLEEAERVLAVHGVIRIAVPDITRIFDLCDKPYLDWLGRSGFGEPTKRSAIKNIVVNHGHQALWTAPLLLAILNNMKFVASEQVYGSSTSGYLCGVEGHHAVIGQHAAEVETTIVEGYRIP